MTRIERVPSTASSKRDLHPSSPPPERIRSGHPSRPCHQPLSITPTHTNPSSFHRRLSKHRCNRGYQVNPTGAVTLRGVGALPLYGLSPGTNIPTPRAVPRISPQPSKLPFDGFRGQATHKKIHKNVPSPAAAAQLPPWASSTRREIWVWRHTAATSWRSAHVRNPHHRTSLRGVERGRWPAPPRRCEVRVRAAVVALSGTGCHRRGCREASSQRCGWFMQARVRHADHRCLVSLGSGEASRRHANVTNKGC